MRGKLGTAAWTAAAIAAAVTLWVLLGMGGSPEPEHNEDHSQGFSRGDPVAVVGEYTLYDTDLALVRAGEAQPRPGPGSDPGLRRRDAGWRTPPSAPSLRPGQGSSTSGTSWWTA